jgi:transposase
MRMFELLRDEGYEGGYDAVRRYGRAWQRSRATSTDAYVPLVFEPGEAYQFDWSSVVVVLNGTTTEVKVAQVRLCHSRMPFIVAYPRETQEMVFDAHERAFALFGGTCVRGIYDNMKTAVDTVYAGKSRKFNRRFLQMCSHYLIEPVACTAGAGWEKGQVENQVGNVREHIFTPRLRFGSHQELNAYLLERCLAEARSRRHPVLKDSCIFDVFEAEREKLVPVDTPFDGYRTQMAAVSKTCLVRFDRNAYSVMASAIGQPVEISAYADRIVIRQDGEIVGEHERCFGRDQVRYNPWHYVPVLMRKPGALRNGAPFKHWVLPPNLTTVQARLTDIDGGDRQMVTLLNAVLTDGLDAVEAACTEALADGVCTATVILNLLARQRQPAVPATLILPQHLNLGQPPLADCQRYDSLRGGRHAAS